MKIKVMIVEDEPIIRMGISRVMPWEEMGCEIVALAENGEDGIEKAEEFHPQIVISDIRMPKMSGLDMIEKLSKSDKKIHYILLTGYKEFEYAQRAIAYGVNDYILKPIDQEKLEKVVRTLVSKILSENFLEEERIQMQEKIQESMPILREKFISDLLFHNSQSIFHIYEKMDFFHITINDFFLVDAEIDSFQALERDFTEDDIQILLFLIEAESQEILGRFGYASIVYKHQKSLYLIIGEGSHKLEIVALQQFAEELSQQMKEKSNFSISVGISKQHNSQREIRTACQEAQRAAAQSYYLGQGSIICYNDFNTDTVDSKGEEIDAEPFYEALQDGRNITEEMKRIEEKIRSLKNMVLVKSFVSELCSKSYRILLHEYGSDEEIDKKFENDMEKVYFLKTIDTFSKFVIELGNWMNDYIAQKRITRNSFVMEKAVAYMKENCRRDLLLEEVADHVFVSKWYFSKLFRKEKGTKFSDYLAALRIDEACKVIRENPTLKNYEVAEIVGFGNVRYFSQLFKKVTGKTPTQYRG